MKPSCSLMGFAMVALLSCSGDKEPAAAAIKAGQATIEVARDEAVKYVPEELKKLETGLKTAQEHFQKKDYAAALGAAKGLASKAQEMAKSALARKEELTHAWEDINLSLPGDLERIGAHFESLGTSVPAGLDKVKLAELKSAFDGLGKQLQEANQAAQSGDIPKAVDLGSAAKAKGVEIAQLIGVLPAQ